MNTNNSLAFRREIFLHIQYFIISLPVPTACQYVKFVFNVGEITYALAWPLNDLYVMKNVCPVNLLLLKITWLSANYQIAFIVNVQCV